MRPGDRTGNRPPQPAPSEISPPAIQQQLSRLLKSATFSRAERSRNLLIFLVNRSLQGNADLLTEARLAVEVFGRRTPFEPDSDAIVRVEAGRLRSRLREYCETEGRDDPILIELPPRTYRPSFRQRLAAEIADASREETPVRPVRRWKTTPALAALLVIAGSAIYGIVVAGRHFFGNTGQGVLNPSAPSIAVLPFLNLSPDKDQEYFCDGLTVEVIETLAKLEGLSVVSPTSVFHFKGRKDEVRTIGAQLHVGMVLEGSVRKEASRLRITVDLVNASSGYYMWSQTFDREMEDVFAIQREIARGIVGTLYNQLGREAWLRPLNERSPKLEAYNRYLEGLSVSRQGSTDATLRATKLYEQSVAIDPQFAGAYAEMAECYALLVAYSAAPVGETMAKAKAAAQKAMELDANQPDAHSALGMVRAIGEWDWAGAALEFQKAHDLDPHDSAVLEARVLVFFVPTRQLDWALAEILDAQTLDPVSPRIQSLVGLVRYFRREYDQGIQELQRATRQSPSYPLPYVFLGRTYTERSRFAEAVAALQNAVAGSSAVLAQASLGHAYARMGRRAEAHALAEELIRLSGERYVSPLHVAAIYAGLSDKQQAFEWLEKSLEQHAAGVIYLAVDPRFDSLRSDPRFTRLLKRIRLM